MSDKKIEQLQLSRGEGIDFWERQPGETSKAWEGFRMYRDAGSNRSMTAVFKTIGRGNSVSLFEKWAWRYHWKFRVEEYDRHLDRVAQVQVVKSIREMTDRHIKIAMAMQNTVAKRLNTFEFDKLSPETLVRWIEAGVKIERLSRGVSTENTEQKITEKKEISIDLSGLSDDELSTLETIATRISAPAVDTARTFDAEEE